MSPYLSFWHFLGGLFLVFVVGFWTFLNFQNMFLIYSKSYVGSIFFILSNLSTNYVFGILGVFFYLFFFTF